TMREYIVAERIDVLVMGAYSHSKLRELVFGGVTRSILTDMPILTLLSR
ncbi:universal stress protein, partial [Paraburkholderia aspalathi]|nr:universal stress protein [Paraburkholderia aspalathi]